MHQRLMCTHLIATSSCSGEIISAMYVLCVCVCVHSGERRRVGEEVPISLKTLKKTYFL